MYPNPMRPTLLALLILLCQPMRGQSGNTSASLTSLSFSSIKSSLLFWEGYHLTPYVDGNTGVMSVGVGHNATVRGEVLKHRYTEPEVDTMLAEDTANALRICRAGVWSFDTLPLGAREVCINLIFLVGNTGFMKFVEFRRALSGRVWIAAAKELQWSRWYQNEVNRSRADWMVNTIYYGERP